ncbi:MAG: hypothetical protein R3C53_14205 [Pirellulaceae bacterium]
MSVRKLEVGSKVVFAKDKVSDSPGKRATEISPQPKGDAYSYIVEKYWVVKQIHDDQTATLVTRRGKEHIVPLDDPRLRKANWWERCFLSSRFPKLDQPPSST